MSEKIPYYEAKKRLYDSLSSKPNLNFRFDDDTKETTIRYSLSNINQKQALYYNLITYFAETIDTPLLTHKTKSGGATLYNSTIQIDMFNDSPVVMFQKKGDFDVSEIESIIGTYDVIKSTNPLIPSLKKDSNIQTTYRTYSAKGKNKSEDCQCSQSIDEEVLSLLEELGAITYTKTDDEFSWDYLAGYDDVKKSIQDTIMFPLENPEIYEKIVRGTRKVYESIIPKAVLFEGPPGTGKTTAARIIANQTDTTLVYVPVDKIFTKWYGESSKNLGQIFDACSNLESSIIFLDEIDSLATSRNNDMNEESRRVLSVLLSRIDGIDTTQDSLVIGATNRKDDLDEAMLSRFDKSLNFRLPNEEERELIYENYAKHLSKDELSKLANVSMSMSGRVIKDICENAERKWAFKIYKQGLDSALPPLEEYLNSVNDSKLKLSKQQKNSKIGFM